MESLKKRLDAIQDELLTIYEEGSELISVQVQHWNLLRKENVLMHYAKKAGVTRLGLQPVPSLRISAEKAKQAIEMQLTLQTLQDSPYATEQWTLQDTSYERWTSEPSHCLKKGPVNVEVYFDGDRGNAMHYTMWSKVYYTDINEKWQKTKSNVDNDGLWFWDNCEKRYYVRFREEAAKYGTGQKWDVVINNEPVCPPESVTSTTPTTNTCAEAAGAANRKRRRVAGGGGTAGNKRQRTRGSAEHSDCETADTTDTSGNTPQHPQEASEKADTHQEVQRLGRPPVARGLLFDPTSGESRPDPGGVLVSGSGGHAASPESVSGRVAAPEPIYSGVLHVPVAPGQGPTPAAAHPAAPAGHAPNALRAEEGPGEGAATGLQGRLPVPGRRRGGSQPLLREAGDSSPSVICLAGPCNTLKCLRYRTKNLHRGLFERISTTWYWAGEGSDRLGEARMLLTFTGNGQRAAFLDRVRLPPTVTLQSSIFSA
ncbi:E2 [Canis familiaris papillomavirus 18]|uniref:Regulatory protein E2 n=1 Tax=Canis familiaris papillomavirus 18 TaxID=1816242 RepID=A0A3G1E4J8_9PAPI|nr:E2 [Canis familiaris papillomavirus 18]